MESALFKNPFVGILILQNKEEFSSLTIHIKFNSVILQAGAYMQKDRFSNTGFLSPLAALI
jgi:hypothetical protein